MDELKPHSEMSPAEREHLYVGIPVVCDVCGKSGVWDPNGLLRGAIIESEFPLKVSFGLPVYVCDWCEFERCLMCEKDGEEKK